MRELIFALLLQTTHLTGLPVPVDADPFTVAFKQPCDLQRDFGQDGPCVKPGEGVIVQAYYDPRTNEMFLSTDWNPENLSDLATVVHELVHYLQDVNDVKMPCAQAFEKQAYDTMFRWLYNRGVGMPSIAMGLTPVHYRILTTCQQSPPYMAQHD